MFDGCFRGYVVYGIGEYNVIFEVGSESIIRV